MKYSKTKEKKMNKNNGITMITLVITIIILIILSAITIRIVKKDGLVEEAMRARNEYKIISSSTDNKITQLKDEESINTVSEKKLVDMYQLALTDGCDGTNCSKPTEHLHFGDYVDYRTDEDINPGYITPIRLNQENTGFDFSTSTDLETTEVTYEKMNWRVMGVDGNKLLLISENPSTIAFRIHGFVGYNNAINLLNTICKKMYSNYQIGAVARSLNTKDIDTYLGGSAYDKTTFNNYGKELEFSNVYHPDTWQSGSIWSGKIVSRGFIYDPNTYITNPKQVEIILANRSSYYLATCSVSFVENNAFWTIERVQNGTVHARSSICSSEGGQSSRKICFSTNYYITI